LDYGIIYDDKNFDKTINFMKVMMSEIIYDDGNFDKIVDI
jgi:hypothetical protein